MFPGNAPSNISAPLPPQGIAVSRYVLTHDDGDRRFYVSTLTGAVLSAPAAVSISQLSPPELNCLNDNGIITSSSPDSEVSLVQRTLDFAKWDASSFMVTIAPTLGCNFSCSYCFERLTDDFRQRTIASKDSRRQIVNFILSNLKGRSSLSVRWFGGEPLLAQEAIAEISDPLVLVCNEANIRFSASVQTNGFLLNQDAWSLFERSHIQDVHISLDGDQQHHDRVRFDESGNGSYETILRNLEAAPLSASISLRVNVTQKNASSIDRLLLDIARTDNRRRFYIYFHPVYAHFNGATGRSSATVGFESVRDYAEMEVGYYQQLSELGYAFPWQMFGPRNLPCSALKVDGVMLDLHGNILKCDHEYGVPSARLGTAKSGIVDIEKLGAWTSVHPRNNPDCPSCELLPSCLGNCESIRRSVQSSSEACPSKKYNFKKLLAIGAASAVSREPQYRVDRLFVHKAASRSATNMAQFVETSTHQWSRKLEEAGKNYDPGIGST